MKFNFRKISAIASSVLLAGMTMGVAAAANYPSPFVDGSTADVAIVYGASSLDSVAASNIQEDLAGSFTGGTTSVSGGEVFTLEDIEGDDYTNFNENLASIYSSLTDDEMAFLEDGTYDDGDIDEDYTQTINLHANGVLSYFDNSDYGDTPEIGFEYDESDLEILNYVIEFTNDISMEDMEDTNLPLFGKTYYVLDVVNGTSASLTLLDTADKSTVKIGETVTVNGKQISLDFVDTNSAKLTVDGELTDDLSENEEFELEDESYIVLTDISYQDYAGGVQSVEFSIGSGKMIMDDGGEIEVNDVTIEGMVADFDVTGDDLTSITITWKTSDDTFLTETSSLTMPIFEAISLVYEGLDFPSESEKIVFEDGETLVLNMGNFDVDLMNSAGATIALGEEDHPLVTSATTRTANFSGTGYTNTSALAGGLVVQKGDRFVVTILDTDLGDVEQAYYEVTTLNYVDSDEMEIKLDDIASTEYLTLEDGDDPDNLPGTTIDVEMLAMNDSDAYLNFTGGAITFDKIVSDKGLVIDLEAKARTATFTEGDLITLTEADYEGDITEGTVITLAVKNSTEDQLYVQLGSAEDSVTEQETSSSSDEYIGYVESPLTSKIMRDESGDEYTFELEYYAKEVPATVKVVTGGEISETGALGNIVVKDTEVSSVSDKNLIVVGGSCINSVAANLVGGAYCGPAFTTATTVGTGQYIVKKYTSPYNADKIALLVAGYEAADTTAASQYVMAGGFDATMANKIGTTSTVI